MIRLEYIHFFSSNLYSGTKVITSNGTYTVKGYQSASVNVSGKTVNIINVTNASRTSDTILKYDISSNYSNYKSITIDNIYVQFIKITGTSGVQTSISYSYDNSTGILTITGTQKLWSTTAFNNNFKIIIIR